MNTREIVRQTWGEPEFSGANYDLYYCQFHEDSNNPSFFVYDEKCGCFACQPFVDQNGNRWSSGNAVNFIQAAHGISYAEAMKFVDNGNFPENKQREAKRDNGHPLPWSVLDETRTPEHRLQAAQYFTKRGIKLASIDRRFLGAREWTMRDISALYMTIPYIGMRSVRKIKQRLNDQDALRVIKTLDEDFLIQVRIKAAARRKIEPELVTDDMIISALFPKYIHGGGIKSEIIFNLDRLVEKMPNGDLLFKRQSRLLIHEGEIKCAVMEDASDQDGWGYPSIHAKAVKDIRKALINVDRIYIVQDNEPDQVRPDGTTFNPGKDYAYKLYNEIGRPNDTEIIKPPDGLKAADDVVNAGFVHQWMSQYNMEPVRLR